jgi:hypothetical protein
MRIVTPPLNIQNDEGFTRDILDRKTFANGMLNLVSRSSDELVISLDGKWGEGKTTFVRMWQGLLSENNIPNIYIDAFANDYVDDAFISIASSITKYASENIPKDKEETLKEFTGKAKKVGVQLLSWSAKVGIKAATLGAVKDSDIDELKDISKDLAKGTSDVIGNFVEERLTSHAKDIEIFESFKSILSKIPSEISNSEDKPLVIIIDELDRCKPTYAVEVIEKVKHLFSVEKVVFVLVMHRTQLEEAVKSVYGQNIDAHTYLQKFINIETSIPKRNGDRYTNDLKKYNEKLMEVHEIETWGDKNHIKEGIEILACFYDLSLRQLERVYTIIAVFYASSSEKQFRLTPLISFLSVIKVIKPILFKRLLASDVTYLEVMDISGLVDSSLVENKATKINTIMDWVKFSLMTTDEWAALPDNDRLRRLYGAGFWEYDIEREDVMPLFTQKIGMFSVV